MSRLEAANVAECSLRAPFVERSYCPDDFEVLLRIERHAGEARWDRRQLEAFLAPLHFDTRIIATALSPAHPIAFYVVEHGDKTLYLANLAVAPEWRRQGVAQFALQTVTALARRLRYARVALDVQEQNLPAQLLYRKAGYRAVQICPNHYQGQDGYRMVQELP